MPLNRALIGKTYPPVTTHVTLEALQEYARAYNDDNPVYCDGSAASGIVAPPMFNAVVTWLALITTISDPELQVDLLRLLHRGQDIHFFSPILPDDQISARAAIISIGSSTTGENLTIGLDATNQRQEVVSRTSFTAVIRGRRERHSASSAIPQESSVSPRQPVVTISQTLDRDQTIRYAKASGDRNPIHLDDEVAKMAGLPGIIVHGLCTMAFVSKVIINHLCGADPVRLRRLAVTFSHPVLPGDTITTTAWREQDREHRRCFGYETHNTAGVVVLRDGIAEIDPPWRELNIL